MKFPGIKVGHKAKPSLVWCGWPDLGSHVRAVRARFQLANYLLGLLPICRPQSFVESFTIHAPINPDRTRAAEMLPTLQHVRTMLLVPAIDTEYDIY